MGNLLANTLQDVRFAFRTLRKNLGFTCAALVTLALGIGANAAIYTVIDGVLLHPIPFPESDRLVAMYQKSVRSEKNSVPYLNLLDWQRQSQTFEGFAAWTGEWVTGVADRAAYLRKLGPRWQALRERGTPAAEARF